MKFKQLRRLIEQYEVVNEGGKGIMVPGLNSQQASDGSVTLHDVTEPEMLERINAGIAAFLSNVPKAGTVDPRDLLVRLRIEMNKVGFDFKYDGKDYPKENMSFALTQFGGRKGMDEKGNKIDDDGITHRLGGPLKLVMTMKHPPEVGFHTIEAKVEKGAGSSEQSFEGGSEAASTLKKKVNEEKDACYHKVKAAHKVFPSAYASGNLVQCRKVGAENWGKRGKKSKD
jgi:hypothetical protein